jgi:biotin carboxyl carrier protein
MLFDATFEGRTVRVEVRQRDGRYTLTLDGTVLDVDAADAGRDFASLIVNGRSYEVGLLARPGGYRVVLTDGAIEVDLADAARGDAPATRKTASGPVRIAAPMPGKIVRVLVAVGDAVAAGAGVVVMEAMKMENELRAPRAGRVKELLVREQQPVDKGAVLVVLE